ncbi:MAG: hypothetical protein QXM86_03550 [Candidatus Bathyarchaeia archaeon]
MAEKKTKRETQDIIEIDQEEPGFVLEPAQIEVGSGYTVSINYENDKPVINIKTYGEVDMAKLQKEIKKAFPEATIRQLTQTGSVTVVKKRNKKTK